MDALVNIQGLHFTYPGTPFKLHIDQLQLATHQHTACIGPSGSGKSTLLRLMAGILTPQSGTVEVLGNPIHTMSDARRRAFRLKNIGMVFQDFALIDYLNVQDNILLPYRISPALQLDDAVRKRSKDLAQSTGLGKYLNRFPAQLSQGERQRLAICRALLPQPRLILADEPTGNLDPENKSTIVQLLKDQAAENEATLIMVTHDHDLLKGFDHSIDFSKFFARDTAYE